MDAINDGAARGKIVLTNSSMGMESHKALFLQVAP